MDKKRNHLSRQRRLFGDDLVAGEADRAVRVRTSAEQEEKEANDVDDDNVIAAAADRLVASRNVAIGSVK